MREASGKSLKPLLVHEANSTDKREIYFEGAGKNHYALRYENYKLIFRPGRKLELYDLSQDPKEKHNLVNKRPDIASEMREKVAKIRKENNRKRQANILKLDIDKNTLERMNKETLEQLKALGYVK